MKRKFNRHKLVLLIFCGLLFVIIVYTWIHRNQLLNTEYPSVQKAVQPCDINSLLENIDQTLHNNLKASTTLFIDNGSIFINESTSKVVFGNLTIIDSGRDKSYMININREQGGTMQYVIVSESREDDVTEETYSDGYVEWSEFTNALSENDKEAFQVQMDEWRNQKQYFGIHIVYE